MDGRNPAPPKKAWNDDLQGKSTVPASVATTKFAKGPIPGLITLNLTAHTANIYCIVHFIPFVHVVVFMVMLACCSLKFEWQHLGTHENEMRPQVSGHFPSKHSVNRSQTTCQMGTHVGINSSGTQLGPGSALHCFNAVMKFATGQSKQRLAKPNANLKTHIPKHRSRVYNVFCCKPSLTGNTKHIGWKSSGGGLLILKLFTTQR